MRTDSTAATSGSVCGGGGGDLHWSIQRGANSVAARGSHSLATSLQSSGSTHPLIASARQLEGTGEYLKAVEQYLKVTPDLLSESGGGGGEGESAATLVHSVETCENLWVHAANLAMKFLTPENSAQVTELVASKLARLQVNYLILCICFRIAFLSGLFFPPSLPSAIQYGWRAAA